MCQTENNYFEKALPSLLKMLFMLPLLSVSAITYPAVLVYRSVIAVYNYPKKLLAAHPGRAYYRFSKLH